MGSINNNRDGLCDRGDPIFVRRLANYDTLLDDSMGGPGLSFLIQMLRFATSEILRMSVSESECALCRSVKVTDDDY